MLERSSDMYCGTVTPLDHDTMSLKMPAKWTMGTSLVWQLCHIGRSKRHYTRNMCGARSMSVRVGRSRGGSVRISEMDTLELHEAGMHNVLQELSDRKDMVITQLCVKCNRQYFMCSCKKPVMATVKIPFSTMRMCNSIATFEQKTLVFDIEHKN